MISTLIIKKTPKQARIDRQYNIPDDITINLIGNITFKNVPIEKMFNNEGYYKLVCELTKSGTKILADVKMSTQITDINKLYAKLDG